MTNFILKDDMHNNKMVPMATRDLSLDLLRGIAVLLIVVVHVTAQGFYQFSDAWWKPVVFYGSFGRMGVPIFFMISGALLLPRAPSPKIIARRVWKVTVPLVFWSFVYLLILDKTASLNLAALQRIIAGPVAIHLWFLYVLIGAYLFLPMLCALFMSASRQNQLVVLAAWFVSASVLQTIVLVNGSGFLGIDFSFMPLYSGYIFLGAFLAHDEFLKRPVATSVAAGLFVFGVAATGCLTWYWSQHMGKPSEVFYSYSSPSVIVSSAGFFLMVRNLAQGFPDRVAVVRRPILWLSSTSFGVYLSHLLMLMYLQEQAINFLYKGPWFGSISVPVFTVIACAAAVSLVQKIPIVRSVCPPS